MDVEAPTGYRLVAVHLDEATLGRGSPEQERERRVAAADLADSAVIAIPQHRGGGPYRLELGLHDGKLVFHLRTEDERPVVSHLLSLTPFRGLLRDYMLLCDTYNQAARTGGLHRVQALDAGRRGLHDQAAELLAQRLAGKIVADFQTMRRLFTLITALHWKR